MAITTGGRVAMKATSRAAKRRVQKMPALEKALTPAQKANKARKVEARQASKARRRANQEAWERQHGDLDPFDFYQTKPSRVYAEKVEGLADARTSYNPNLLTPLENRIDYKGLTKAFSPDDVELIRRIHDDPYKYSSYTDDAINRAIRLLSELDQTAGETAVEQFSRLLPTWSGSIEDLVGLIKMGVL
jgi:hypothetical protein